MVELVNNHVLIPEPANWRERPGWKRRWQNAVSPAVTGAESRRALRAEPRAELTWQVLCSGPALARFEDRVRAALKSGLACAPFYGRGFLLQNIVNADTAVLDRDWSSTFAPYLFLTNAADLYEVRQVEDVDGDILTFDQAVTRTYTAGLYCWPLLFGKFTCDDLSPRAPSAGSLKLTISERISPASVQLGEVVPGGGGGGGGGGGIGTMIIGSTFQIA